MAISEKKYAAEFVTVEGDALKFDDITCLTDYVAEKNNQAQIAAFFVVDLKTQQWLRGERAWLVHSPRYKTPMSGGIVAFRDKADAANEAGKTGGKLMNFEDVVKTSGKSGK
jgi:copper chaperone NosL